MMSSPFLPTRVCYSLRNPSKLPQGSSFLNVSLGSTVWMDRAKATKDIHRGLCTESSYTGWQERAHMRTKPLFRHSEVGLFYRALNGFCVPCTVVPSSKRTAPGNSPLCLLASLKRSGLYSINVKEQKGLLYGKAA